MARTAARMHGHFSCELCGMHQSLYEIGPTSDGRADEHENHHEELQLIETFPLLYLVLTLGQSFENISSRSVLPVLRHSVMSDPRMTPVKCPDDGEEWFSVLITCLRARQIDQFHTSNNSSAAGQLWSWVKRGSTYRELNGCQRQNDPSWLPAYCICDLRRADQ